MQARTIERLGDAFYDRVTSAEFAKVDVRYRNDVWARRLGLAGLEEDEWVRRFARFEPFDGGLPQPLALRYHGHQFRVYNPDIGDGRGFLYAQVRDLEDGRLLDLATKGSGTTPYSRAGDGRLTLKGGMREILAAEMLEALGVYTSKAFSLIETGESLWRGDEPSPTRSSVLTRLSHGHIRFGTFQRFAYEEDDAAIATLVRYVDRHLLGGEGDRPAEEAVLPVYRAVVEGTAELAASWMAAGFVHGVLNTDNMSVTAESFDYGPWRFLPDYDPAFTAAYFDHGGLYAFGRQAEAAHWNLARLAECLLPLAERDDLIAVIDRFAILYRDAYVRRVLERLGLASAGPDDDAATARAWLAFLAESRAPFEAAHFDHWARPLDPARAGRSPRAAQYRGEAYDAFLRAANAHAPLRADALAHPYFAREDPCTMTIDRVETLWAAIADEDDWGPFEGALDHIAEAREAYAFDPNRGRARLAAGSG